MRTSAELLRVARAAGDAYFPGLWISSPSALVASLKDQLALCEALGSPEAIQLRGDLFRQIRKIQDGAS